MGCLLLVLLLFGGGFWSAQSSGTAPAVEIAYGDSTGVTITRFASALSTDADGCPLDETSTYRRSQDINVFAIGAFPRGTTVFARMYYDGVPVEDTDMLIADRNYDDVCVYFIFEPTIGAEVFDRGPYRIEFYVNEVLAGSVNVVVQ
ncbi:MAG TPA: hypothetical protein VK003_17640 [Oceanobacillus sp.]|nr:hypothetical protein [Oceanobacillus sp.]